ncbi:unnamed protein product [Brachionus calyciflorus]|uniref:Reverse transcriptase domain-containing protein n=1 Tax=Brachionus calyciflorus TaxID=104777 RepID=A0A813Z945_9BILA|nr:unnamed protein product [Brachionus calyciflorus]
MLIKWIKSFLFGRKQRVVFGETASEWVDVDSGVSQGSVLGPLLFIIYINDMFEMISNSCSAELTNVDKSKIINVGNNNTKFDYIMESQPLTKSDCEKDLGIYIQSDLKWDTQIKYASSKANRIKKI